MVVIYVIGSGHNTLYHIMSTERDNREDKEMIRRVTSLTVKQSSMLVGNMRAGLYEVVVRDKMVYVDWACFNDITYSLNGENKEYISSKVRKWDASMLAMGCVMPQSDFIEGVARLEYSDDEGYGIYVDEIDGYYMVSNRMTWASDVSRRILQESTHILWVPFSGKGGSVDQPLP